jgi:CheY-like chemotaxis protein
VGNAAELREVFTNLINNSLDAMPKGGTLSLSAACDTQTATVTVQDTGIGIPRSVIDRIFDPFFTTKGPRSTGLGMSVSYGIVRRHNGSISVSSEEGSGATLTIKLPLGREECRVRPDIESAVQDGASLQVLVIDDDEDVREVLVDMLTSIGHRVESASDGLTGLEMFRATPFDLVFTDLGMPGISGWDVAREVKTIREETLVALVTGWDVQYQRENIEQYRIDFILHKPFQVSNIMDVVSMARKRLNGTY